MAIFERVKKAFLNTVKYYDRLNLNIMIFIIYGILHDTVIYLYKPFATKYLERLGGSNLHITLYNSLPGVVAVIVLLPCLFIMTRFKNKQKIASGFIMFGRIIILGMAFIPLFAPELRPVIFVGLVALLNFPEAVSEAAMQNILGSMFGGKDRGIAISVRNQIGYFAVMVVTLVTGLILSFIPKTEEQRMLWYQIFFVIAFFIGILEVIYFMKMKEENNREYVAQSEKSAKIKDIPAIFKDKKFTLFALCSILYYISYHGGWAISSIFTIKNLGANEIWLALTAVSSGLASFFSGTWWNKYISKYGNERALPLAGFIMGVNTLLIVISPNLYFLLFQSAVNGFGVMGLTVTLLNGLLLNTPDKNRILYIGVYNTMVNLSLSISPMIIQIIMDRTGIHFVMYLIGFLRIIFAGILFYVYVVRIKNKKA